MSDHEAISGSTPSINPTNQLDQLPCDNLLLSMQFPPGIHTQHGFACSGHHHYQASLHTNWPGQQLRGYKSLKKSMKPINNRASRLAVQPFLPAKLEQNQEVPQPYPKDIPVVDTVLPPLPKAPVPAEFRRVARITGEYMLELQPAFAVVQIQGTQFKVTVDDILFVNHIKDTAVNEVLALDRVMLFGSKESTSIGRPYVPNSSVLVAVEEHFRDGELHVFKFKKRNRYKKYHTYRHAMTALRVIHIAKDSSSEDALVSQPIAS